MANWSTQTATRECQIASNGDLTVVERLASLLETGQFADVTIRVGEGEDAVIFKAHRLLLATASQPLNSLFQAGVKNGPGEVATLRVTDVTPDAFHHVLRYIYTDNLQICGAGEGLTLLKLGKKWGLQNLVDKTVKFLEDFLNEYEPITEESKNQLCDLIVLTEEYGLELKNKCWKVLMKNVNDVVPCQGFLNMTKDMLRRLLTDPDFKFKNQLVLFESIRDWGMNQVLIHNLSVSSLQGLIGEFLQFVDFNAIKDNDFLETILPSDCLGKSELIAFFMSRSLEIPRDLAYNNNTLPESKLPYEKTARYKRGYKLPNQEIYKEHELRFRVDKRLQLLGVGFGFLFSNTDMGITVHCQGPWETRQWRDIIQTYCRVTYEKMKTADVRLMFSEPVVIEPNHCYKILVRVGRMSAGASDVDLWGGAQGVARLKMKDADFCFLKAAVDPKKDVEDSDTENKPGMITDLFYELDDGSAPMRRSIYSSLKQEMNLQSPDTSSAFDSICTHVDEDLHRDSPRWKDYANAVANTISPVNCPSPSIYREVTSKEDDISSSTPHRKKSAAEEASSYYLAYKPSTFRGTDTIPAFLRGRQSSVERSKPAWQIPFRTRKFSSAYTNTKSREPSANRETSVHKDSASHLTLRSAKQSSGIFDNSPLTKYSQGISSTKSKYDLSSHSASKTYDPLSAASKASSRYGSGTSKYATSSTPSNTSYSQPEPSYGNSARQVSYTSARSDSRYGASNAASASLSTSDNMSNSRYSSGASSSRLGRDKTISPSRFSTATPSRYRYEQSISQNTSREAGTRWAGTSSSLGSSRYGTSSNLSHLGPSSRYTSGSSGATNVAANAGSDRKYGLNSSGASGSTSSAIGSSKRYDSNPSSSTSTATSSSVASSRYGGNSSSTSSGTANTSNLSSLGSRYSSSSYSSPSSYLSSSRFGANTPIVKSYSGISSRFGTSIYRR